MKKIIVYCLFLSLSVSVALPTFANLITTATNTTTEPSPESIKTALAEFKNLSKKERKERTSEVKKEWKKIKKENKESKSAKVEQVVLIILAILLPPLAVYLHQGEVNGKFWISLLLWFLFMLPGVIYALLVVTDNA